MTAIGPGDFVECVRLASPAPGKSRAGFTVGGIYTVESCGVIFGHPWLILRGMPRSDSISGGWDARYFRPVYRPNADLIRDLMQPVDDGVPA